MSMLRMRGDRSSVFREIRSVCMSCLDSQGTIEQDLEKLPKS